MQAMFNSAIQRSRKVAVGVCRVGVLRGQWYCPDRAMHTFSDDLMHDIQGKENVNECV